MVLPKEGKGAEQNGNLANCCREMGVSRMEILPIADGCRAGSPRLDGSVSPNVLNLVSFHTDPPGSGSRGLENML